MRLNENKMHKINLILGIIVRMTITDNITYIMHNSQSNCLLIYYNGKNNCHISSVTICNSTHCRMTIAKVKSFEKSRNNQ